jgi:hypothetical protein
LIRNDPPPRSPRHPPGGAHVVHVRGPLRAPPFHNKHARCHRHRHCHCQLPTPPYAALGRNLNGGRSAAPGLPKTGVRSELVRRPRSGTGGYRQCQGDADKSLRPSAPFPPFGPLAHALVGCPWRALPQACPPQKTKAGGKKACRSIPPGCIAQKKTLNTASRNTVLHRLIQGMGNCRGEVQSALVSGSLLPLLPCDHGKKELLKATRNTVSHSLKRTLPFRRR